MLGKIFGKRPQKLDDAVEKAMAELRLPPKERAAAIAERFRRNKYQLESDFNYAVERLTRNVFEELADMGFSNDEIHRLLYPDSPSYRDRE